MPRDYPEFFTATILNWRCLLRSDQYKEIILQSLRHLVEHDKIILYAFVIMPSHIHLIWKMRENIRASDVQRDFLRFTAHAIRRDLLANDRSALWSHEVNTCDREFQFWKRRSLSIPILYQNEFMRILNYIHYNPIRKGWKLANSPEDYFYSSARFHLFHDPTFPFLTHWQVSHLP